MTPRKQPLPADAVDPGRAPATRWAGTVAAAATWAALAPYLASALGFELDVPARLEVIDHVVPGAVALAAAGAVAAWRPVPGSVPWLAAAGAAFLAGFWAVATHVPLLPEAVSGISPWDAALVHLSAGPPLTVAGALMLFTRPNPLGR